MVACAHGNIYAVKFLLWGKSQRDYLDISRSLKHKRNLLIYYMPHIVAQQANIHHGDFSSQTKAELLKQHQKILLLPYKTTWRLHFHSLKTAKAVILFSQFDFHH